MESGLPADARPLSAVSGRVSHHPVPQSSAGTRLHGGAIHLGLPSVPASSLLHDSSSAGDRRRADRAVALSTLGPRLLLDLRPLPVHAYFWTFDPVLEECVVRPKLTVGGMASVWSVWSWVTASIAMSVSVGLSVCPRAYLRNYRSASAVWSWVTELSVFGAVPLSILALNTRVISETRKISARDLHVSSRLPAPSLFTSLLAVA